MPTTRKVLVLASSTKWLTVTKDSQLQQSHFRLLIIIQEAYSLQVE